MPVVSGSKVSSSWSSESRASYLALEFLWLETNRGRKALRREKEQPRLATPRITKMGAR